MGSRVMDEYIERGTLMRRIKEIHCAECDSYHGVRCRACWVDDTLDYIDSEPAADVEKMSDGYHTFADLYEQRLILSAALAKNNPHAWKSKRHEDGSVPFGGGWFIMGFDTDEGCYTYHYELKDWDLFQCEELDKGKPWDGHTSKDVRRLLSIPAADVAPVVHGRWEPYFEEVEIYNAGGFAERIQTGWICGRCKSVESITRYYKTNYCPNCGAKME